jgi:hypothetical protein
MIPLTVFYTRIVLKNKAMQTLLVRTVEDITILLSHRQQGQGLNQRQTLLATLKKKGSASEH